MAITAKQQAALYWARKRRRAPFTHSDNATGHFVLFTRGPSVDGTWGMNITTDNVGVIAKHTITFDVVQGDSAGDVATKADAAIAAAAIPNVGAMVFGDSLLQLQVGAPLTLVLWNIYGDEGYSISVG